MSDKEREYVVQAIWLAVGALMIAKTESNGAETIIEMLYRAADKVKSAKQ